VRASWAGRGRGPDRGPATSPRVPAPSHPTAVDSPSILTGVPKFATKHWRPRVKEFPINLSPEELGIFLEISRERHPDTCAIVALGFILGARPSSLRPIRYRARTATTTLRRGRLCYGARICWVRPSTKNAEDVTIILPEPMRATLQRHIDTHLTYTFDPKNEKRPSRTRTRMAKSELLFPSGTTGSFHGRSPRQTVR
jgi:hypothetical protein